MMAVFQECEDGSEDGAGFGAGFYANSLNHSDERLEMKEVIAEHDDVALDNVTDVARELSSEYPYRQELDQAEATFFDKLQNSDHQEVSNEIDKSEETNLN